MTHGNICDMDGFTLGTPALICRWRLSNRHLPLQNRHLRALLARTVEGKPLTKELVAWAKQHIEWTLDQGAAEHPDGTLMLMLDREGRAAMTVGPYEPLTDLRLSSLTRRATSAAREGQATGVAPETLWIVHDDVLYWDGGEGGSPSGCASLVSQLARTLGLHVVPKRELLESLGASKLAYDEAFLVSDEHGIVPASNARGPHGIRMAQGYQRLLERA